MFFPPTEGVENGVVEVFEGLVATNLDGPREHAIFLGKTFGDGTTEEIDLQGIEEHFVLVWWLCGSWHGKLHDSTVSEAGKGDGGLL